MAEMTSKELRKLYHQAIATERKYKDALEMHMSVCQQLGWTVPIYEPGQIQREIAQRLGFAIINETQEEVSNPQ